ncbi:DUF169 domain-containing protein [Devosia sp. CN2-171]|uniref:DUF169 domain-containing protein n=1 Tax=Devosia sp. CN2-171 TaxID=3400909 RepID=UPI003BF822A7
MANDSDTNDRTVPAVEQFREQAAELTELLGLAVPPIAITFLDHNETGIPRLPLSPSEPTADGRSGMVPAGCVFWVMATTKTFSTIPEDHGNCSVGSVTHGLIGLAEAATKADVQAVCEAGWVTLAAMQGITVVKSRPESIVYGPLAETPLVPSVVLMRLHGKQQMMLHDAWPSMRLEGKPQCHIIAIAHEGGEVAMSVGCMLSRVRTGMSNNEVTCAVPASLLGQVIEQLEVARSADLLVARYAAHDAKRFPREARGIESH